MRRRVLLGLVLLLATVAVLSPTTEQASAEGGPVLVSNLAQTSSSSLSSLSTDWAQGFTTGGRSGGYTLTSVDWAITQLTDTAVFTTGLTATINSESGLNPGAVVGTLTNPAFEATTSERTYTFTAPSGGIHLAANTTYYFVVDVQRGISTSNGQFAPATGSAEDASSQSGWSGAASVPVVDNDAPGVEVGITVENASAAEGGYLYFTVRLSEALTEEITVDWNTATAWDEAERAHRGDDYEEVFLDELVFAPSITEMTGRVWLEEDGEAEEDERFAVQVFLPDNWWPPDATGIMTIVDGD